MAIDQYAKRIKSLDMIIKNSIGRDATDFQSDKDTRSPRIQVRIYEIRDTPFPV